MNNISTTSAKTSSSSWDDPTIKTLNYLVAYISLFNVFFGFIGNTICFLVLITSKDLKRMSYAIYLMYCSIVNILSLLQWNFNHFLRPIFAFNIEDTSIINCRFFTFLYNTLERNIEKPLCHNTKLKKLVELVLRCHEKNSRGKKLTISNV